MPAPVKRMTAAKSYRLMVRAHANVPMEAAAMVKTPPGLTEGRTAKVVAWRGPHANVPMEAAAMLKTPAGLTEGRTAKVVAWRGQGAASRVPPR